MNQPILHNIRILDFTWVLAGPYATRLLGDFGAEVIKVQPLLSIENDDAFERGYYDTWNRNKLGITLNLDKPEGIKLAKKLVSVCDVVIENFTPRVMANWGLGYANLKEIKPDIIMVSMSAMGQKSAKNYYTGFAPTVHALSGLTGLMAVDGKPVGPGFSFADHIAGLYSSMSLLAALEHRRQTGEGQHIDLSETDLVAGLLKDQEPPGEVNLIVPCNSENRWMAVTVDSEDTWQGLKRAMENPAWANKAEYITPEARSANKNKLNDNIRGWIQKYKPEEALSLLQKNNVPAGMVQDAAEIARDPQLKAREFFKSGGTPFFDAPPIRMSYGGAEHNRAAPPPGRDNDYIYSTLLGLSKKEIGSLKKKGVI